MPIKPLTVDTLTHDEATRRNAPTAELETFVPPEMKRPIQVAYERRNRDLDPQLVWRGKDVADWSDLVVEAPPLYIQEKIHPKALIEDLKRASARAADDAAPDLFADFNGVPKDAQTEFYAHDQHWSNRMILGDGLKVMASLAEREGLKGQVQCIYIDPPYGIKFNSNFQWSTTSRDVKDGKADHLTREPEQVKAFRDTWADGIHSYLTYLRDRLTVARDLLTESGSVFVQIGDENVHRVRALMDEVFGEENFVALIRRNRSIARSRRRNGRWLFFTRLFAQRPISCFSWHPRSVIAALYERRPSVVIVQGEPWRLSLLHEPHGCVPVAGPGDIALEDLAFLVDRRPQVDHLST